MFSLCLRRASTHGIARSCADGRSCSSTLGQLAVRRERERERDGVSAAGVLVEADHWRHALVLGLRMLGAVQLIRLPAVMQHRLVEAVNVTMSSTDDTALKKAFLEKV